MEMQNNESGSIMVEAAIIFPMVLLAVMAMLYLGLFKLQETAMLYQVQRVASEGSLMVSSPGYASLTGNGSMLDGKNIDWSEFPEGEAIVGYYKAYHKDASTLYRELSGLSELSEKMPWIKAQEVESFGEKVLNTVSVLAAGRLFQSNVSIKSDFWGASVVAEVKYEVRTPGVLRFFNLPDTITIKQGAYRRAANPAGFMRNTDLAADALIFISEKLGLDKQLGKIIESLGKMRDFLF